jgi:hypothetical protein
VELGPNDERFQATIGLTPSSRCAAPGPGRRRGGTVERRAFDKIDKISQLIGTKMRYFVRWVALAACEARPSRWEAARENIPGPGAARRLLGVRSISKTSSRVRSIRYLTYLSYWITPTRRVLASLCSFMTDDR